MFLGKSDLLPQGNSGKMVDKEVIREGGDVVIVIRPIIKIGAARESVSTISDTSDVFEFEIVFGKVVDVSGNAAVNLLGVTVVRKVRMVDANLDRDFGTRKKVAPMCKAENETHKLAVPNIIVSFGFGKGS